MKGKWIGWGAVALGALMAGAGIWMAREFAQAQGLMAALPYVLIGLGCGAFGYGAGAAANAMVARRYPDVARDKEIEEKDERNVAIANRAKARALDSMYYVFGALMAGAGADGNGHEGDPPAGGGLPVRGGQHGVLPVPVSKGDVTSDHPKQTHPTARGMGF